MWRKSGNSSTKSDKVIEFRCYSATIKWTFITHISERPCSLMDKAFDFGSRDCRFESCQGLTIFYVI